MLIEFDEMGFAPTTVCPNAEEYANDWRERVRKEFDRCNEERKQLEDRAELAEAFHNLKCKDYDLLNYQFEKMKHRAEVAERALWTACVNLIKDEEDNVNMELLAHVVYTKFLRKAEKELAEEKKE